MRLSREDLVMLLAAAMFVAGATLTLAYYFQWWADILHALMT